MVLSAPAQAFKPVSINDFLWIESLGLLYAWHWLLGVGNYASIILSKIGDTVYKHMFENYASIIGINWHNFRAHNCKY